MEFITKQELNKLIRNNSIPRQISAPNITDSEIKDGISPLTENYNLISSNQFNYYGLRVYSNKTSPVARYILFRVQTRENEFGMYVYNNYPGNTFLSARGTDLNFYLSGGSSGAIYTAVNPANDFDKSFNIPIPIGGQTISIPVRFYSLSVNGSGYSNLSYIIRSESGWKDNFDTSSTLDADRAKCFVVSVLDTNSRIAQSRIKITYRVGMEDNGGIKTNVYPTFDTGYFSYIG